MSAPKVSVIIPCYNDDKWVKKSIQSVLNQTYEKYELYVVDDGSQDKSARVIERYTHKEGVHLLEHEDNKGLSEARNTGIRESDCELLCFLDADDIWYPEKLSRQIETIKEQPSAGLIYCAFEKIDKSGSVIERVRPLSYNNENFLRKLFIKGAKIIPSSVMIRRKVLKNVGLFDTRLKMKEEIDLWLRVAKKYNINYISEYLVQKRELGDSLGSNVKDSLKYQKITTDKLVNKYPVLSDVKHKRKAQLKNSVATFCLKNGKLHESRKFALKALNHNHWFYKSYLIVALTFLNPGLAKKIFRYLSKMRKVIVAAYR